MLKIIRTLVVMAFVLTAAAGYCSSFELQEKLASLEIRRICVLTGSAGDLAARAGFPAAQFQNMLSAADAALAVKTGKCDAFIYDKSVLLNIARKNPELVIVAEPVARLEVAAAIGKNNTELLDSINRALSSMQNDGILTRLRQKWIDTGVVSSHAPQTQKKELPNGVLKAGTCAMLEPFSFKAGNSLTGLDIELGFLLGDLLGKRVEFLDMNFEALIPALHSGKIDIALSDFNVTEERKKLVSFSKPYITNDVSALVRRTGLHGSTGAGSRISSPEDLKNRKIGVILGTTHDAYATRAYPAATIIRYKNPSDMMLGVKTGKVDAGIYSREELVEMMKVNEDLGLVNRSLFDTPVGIAFNHKAPELRNAFNRFLGQIRQNGQYDDMVKRWITDAGTTMPALPPAPAGKELVAGIISDNGLPFTTVRDNRLVGFNIELMDRFGIFMGRPIRYLDMEFGSLIAAAATGKIDMIATVLAITDERKKQVSFSDPYYALGAYIFALKKNLDVPELHSKQAAGSGMEIFFGRVTEGFRNNILQEKRYLIILDGLKTTLIISVLSTLCGTLLGGIVCFMRMSRITCLSGPAMMYISVMRGTPVLVLLMLIYYVVFASLQISPILVAVIAFGMNFGAYTSEIFRTGIEGIDRGQTEAGISLGFTKSGTFIYIVLPQMIKRILPVYKGELISLVKMTSIVGYIAVQDLTKAGDIIRSRTFDAFFPLVMIAILYFLISWGLMQALTWLEKISDPSADKKTE